MITKTVTYETLEDEDGKTETVTEKLYFHMNEVDITTINARYKGGLESAIRELIRTEDQEQLLEMYKNIILGAYGYREEGGKAFIKSKELSDRFANTQAYNAIFMELATNEGELIKFIKGILPKDIVAEINRLENEAPPTPPTHTLTIAAPQPPSA